MQLNGSQIFVEVLCEQGVDTIFGYPGGAVLNLYDELYKNADRITHVLTAHEQGAAHAADGYARATGRTGVVLATSGPGATNLVTGIATAYMDSVPMVAFTGNVPTSSIGKSFLKSYAAVCLEGAVIVLACIIFSLFAASPPTVDPNAAAVSMVWSYIGELVFNMLVLVGAVKMADRIVREMMGL